MDIVHNKNDENIENQKTYEICLSDIWYYFFVNIIGNIILTKKFVN